MKKYNMPYVSVKKNQLREKRKRKKYKFHTVRNKKKISPIKILQQMIVYKNDNIINIVKALLTII